MRRFDRLYYMAVLCGIFTGILFVFNLIISGMYFHYYLS